MLRRSAARLGGMDISELYPHGVPRRTFPYREHKKHVGAAPSPGGFYITKHSMGWPFNAPFDVFFYRSPIIAILCTIAYDIVFGIPQIFDKEAIPGQSSHYWFNNNGGKPHHFWQFQDGFYVPNESGARRPGE